MSNHFLGILTGFEEDRKEFYNSVAPFLSDADVDEGEQEDIVAALWKKLGKETVVTSPNTKVRIRGHSCDHSRNSQYIRPYTYFRDFSIPPSPSPR